jgi:TolB-like protein
MIDNKNHFSSEVETGIAGYLRQVRRALERSGKSHKEIEGIVTDLESQIRCQLGTTNGGISDLNALLSRMDPPEMFTEADGYPPPLTHPVVLPSRISMWRWGALLVAVVVAIIIVYYLAVDIKLYSNREVSSLGVSVNTLEDKTGNKSTEPIRPSGRHPRSSMSEPPTNVTGQETAVASPAVEPVRLSMAIAGFTTSDNISDKQAVEITVADGLINALAFDPTIRVVEREKLREGLAELKLGAEGLLDSATAGRLGKIVGAQVIIAGTVVKLDDKLIITARVINSETSELTAVRVTGSRAELLALVDELAQGIVARLRKDEKGTIVRRAPDTELEKIREKQRAIQNAIAGKQLPRLLVMIPETHLGQRVPDPAGETELVLWFTDCGFIVASPDYHGIRLPGPASETTSDTQIAFHRNRGWRNEEGNINLSSRMMSRFVTGSLEADRAKLLKVADVVILGEGISERGSEREGLISCKARLELKVVDVRSGHVLLAKSDFGAGVDVAERIAGKRALQAAGNNMAADLIVELVNKWTALHP